MADADERARSRAYFAERQALKQEIGRRAPVTRMVGFLFPRESNEFRDGIVAALHARNVTHGSDLICLSAGRLHDDFGLPEWVCKVFLDRELVQDGAPRQVMWYGSSFKAKREIPQRLQAIYDAAIHLLGTSERVDYQRAVGGRTWMEVAKGHMSAAEQEDALCNVGTAQFIYGYRAMLRIMASILPTTSTLEESSSFIGTLNLMAGHADEDWSKLVWCLQVMPPDIHPLEARGRLVMNIQRAFANQPHRKFALGAIGSPVGLEVYMFEADEQKLVDGLLVPVPKAVTSFMLSMHRAHSGVEMLMLLMCAPLDLLGFVSDHPSSSRDGRLPQMRVLNLDSVSNGELAKN